jgi:putative transposase
MPRLARAVAVGFAHHITQRGNNRHDVFFVDDDRRVYLELLKEQANKYSLELVGYCLRRINTRSATRSFFSITNQPVAQ